MAVPLLMVALWGSGCGLFRNGGEAELTARDEPAALQQAVDWTRRQAELDPHEPYWPHHLAELQLRAGAGDDAERALRRALERDSGYAPSLTLLSRLLYEDGRYAEGAELLQSVRIDSFAVPVGRVLAAGLALHEERLGEGELAAQTIAPYRADVDWEQLGSVMTYLQLRSNDFKDAAGPAERALEARESAVNLNNRGIARLLTGDPDAARADFQRAHEIDPELAGPLYNLAIVEKFYFFDDSAALSYFQRYAVLSAEDPDGLRTIFEVDAQSRVLREAEAKP